MSEVDRGPQGIHYKDCSYSVLLFCLSRAEKFPGHVWSSQKK